MFHEIRAGFKAALHQIEVVSNNMSNAKTTGFKRSEAMFEDLYANNFSGSEVDRGMAARVIGNKRSHIQGSMIQTKQTLDMAVSGAECSCSVRCQGRQIWPIHEMARFH